MTVQASSDLGTFAAMWPGISSGDTDSVQALVFQCRDHLETWMDTIGAETATRPVFVTVCKKNGEPVLALPLGVSRRGGVDHLTFLDAGVADYNAPIVYPAGAGLDPDRMAAIWRTACRLAAPFDVVRLEKIPEYVGACPNPLYPLAREPWPASGHTLDLCSTGDDERVRRSHEVRESRRKRKRLSRLGEIRFGIATTDADIRNLFDIFVRQKSRRYRESQGNDGFDVPGQLDYYLRLTQRLSGRGAQLAYLSVGSEVVATAWSLIAGRRLYYMMAGYEAGKWRTHSPGWLLLEELVKWSSENGIEVFDFGIGDEAYKHKWQQQSLRLGGTYYPRTPKGWAYCAARRSFTAAKTALPEPAKSRIKAWLGRGPPPPPT